MARVWIYTHFKLDICVTSEKVPTFKSRTYALLPLFTLTFVATLGLLLLVKRIKSVNTKITRDVKLFLHDCVSRERPGVNELQESLYSLRFLET